MHNSPVHTERLRVSQQFTAMKARLRLQIKHRTHQWRINRSPTQSPEFVRRRTTERPGRSVASLCCTIKASSVNVHRVTVHSSMGATSTRKKERGRAPSPSHLRNIICGSFSHILARRIGNMRYLLLGETLRILRRQPLNTPSRQHGGIVADPSEQRTTILVNW